MLPQFADTASHGETPGLLDKDDVEYILGTLEPNRFTTRARQMDLSEQAVLGARAAWQEARLMLAGRIQDIVEREKPSEDDEAALRALLDEFQALQAVSPLELPFWRDLATLCHPDGPWRTQASVWISYPAPSVRRQALRSACLIALTEVLEDCPGLNRAYLDGRIWQRHSPEILVPIRFGPDDLSAAVVDARGATVEGAWNLVRKERARQAQLRKSPYRPLMERLLAQWVWHGFIASPAGALLSDIGSSRIYETPTPAFVPANGIPISIVVGDDLSPAGAAAGIKPSGCYATIAVDHRVIDPAEATPLHVALSVRVPELLSSAG